MSAREELNFNEEKFGLDVRLRSKDGLNFYFNSYVLYLYSEYFRALLKERKDKGNEFILVDYSGETVGIILKWLYDRVLTANSPLNVLKLGNMAEILDFARYYQIDYLLMSCQHILCDTEITEFSVEQLNILFEYDLPQFKSLIVRKFSSNITEIENFGALAPIVIEKFKPEKDYPFILFMWVYCQEKVPPATLESLISPEDLSLYEPNQDQYINQLVHYIEDSTLKQQILAHLAKNYMLFVQAASQITHIYEIEQKMINIQKKKDLAPGRKPETSRKLTETHDY